MTHNTKSKTIEVDIGQEFKDVKSQIADLTKEISNWKTIIETQLAKLNINMEKVLSQIADHEGRISILEKKQAECRGFANCQNQKQETFWFLIRFIIGAASTVAAAGGGGWILKFLQVIN